MGSQIEWRRGFPRRAARMPGGCAAAAAVVATLAWALFGDEPARLNTGAADPLAVVPQWTCLAAVVGAAVVPAAQVTALAAYAPETVEITSRL